jgi:hypothetical protein
MREQAAGLVEVVGIFGIAPAAQGLAAQPLTLAG